MNRYLLDADYDDCLRASTLSKKKSITRPQAVIGSLEQIQLSQKGVRRLYTHNTFEKRRKFINVDGYIIPTHLKSDHVIIDIMKKNNIEAVFNWPLKISHKTIHLLRLFQKKGVAVGILFPQPKDVISTSELSALLRTLIRQKL